MARVAVYAPGLDWTRQIAQRHVSKSTAARLLQDGYHQVGIRAIQQLNKAELQARRAEQHLHRLRCEVKLPPIELPGIRFVPPPPAEQRDA